MHINVQCLGDSALIHCHTLYTFYRYYRAVWQQSIIKFVCAARELALDYKHIITLQSCKKLSNCEIATCRMQLPIV